MAGTIAVFAGQREETVVRTRLRDIAELAGVSVATVSQALSADPSRPVSIKTQAHVLAAAERLSHHRRAASGAGALPRSATRKVGLILPAVSYKFSDPFWSRVLDGIDVELTRRRYSTSFVLTVDELTERFQRGVAARERVGGVMLLGNAAPFPDLANLSQLVTIEGLIPMRARGLDIDAVVIEKRQAMYDLVAHLASLGRTRIGFLGPAPEDDERAEAFPHALSRVDLPYDPTLVLGCPWSIEGGHQATQTMLARARPLDALVCASDEIALGAMRAAKEAGLQLPCALAITGFDDLLFAESLDPPLTTVRVPKEVLGQVAARRMIERIRNPDLPAITVTVRTSLVTRASCGEERSAG